MPLPKRTTPSGNQPQPEPQPWPQPQPEPQPQPTPVPNSDKEQTQQTPLSNLPPNGNAVPNNGVKSELGCTAGMGNGIPNHTGTPLCASDVERIIIQGATARNRKFIASIVRASNMHPVVMHLYPEPPQPQMVRLQTLLAHQDPTGEAGEHIC